MGIFDQGAFSQLFGGGGDPEISYTQSKEQKEVMRMMMPMLAQLFGGNFQAPQFPGPTSDWYSNLSPDIMSGLQQPYMEAQQQGLELLGMGGAAGSARGGASGTAGAMTGEIMGQMAQNVPLQAWEMGAQGRASEYQAGMLPYTGALASLSGTYPEAVVNPGGNQMMNMLPLLLMML